MWYVKTILSVCVVAVLSSIVVWYGVYRRAVDLGLERGIRKIVKLNPTLQHMLDRADEDGVLTMSEANAIIDAAETLKNPPK